MLTIGWRMNSNLRSTNINWGGGSNKTFPRMRKRSLRLIITNKKCYWILFWNIFRSQIKINTIRVENIVNMSSSIPGKYDYIGLAIVEVAKFVPRIEIWKWKRKWDITCGVTLVNVVIPILACDTLFVDADVWMRYGTSYNRPTYRVLQPIFAIVTS